MGAVFEDKVIPGTSIYGTGFASPALNYGQIKRPQAKAIGDFAHHLAFEPRAAKDHRSVAQEKLELRLGVAHAEGTGLEVLLRRALNKPEGRHEFGIGKTARH